MLLKRIVDRVLEETKEELLHVAKHPIGLDEAFQAFQNTISKSNDQYSSCAKLVGIVGMGGVGKTTLAKKVYNERSSSYKGCCCFLSDVRLEASKSGLTSLQSKLLQKLLHYDKKIDSISHGIEMMKNCLQNRKVLLVLDDVDNVDHIDALLVKDVLGPGSLVILTSRYKDVLLSSGVVIFHEVIGLRENQARELFCWHAFLLPSPLKEFETLVETFLTACSGLPLSLKVIGALLYKKDLCYWNGTLEKMGKHILPGTIVDTLKVSLDALDREEKEIFLDIACFFAGEEKNKLIRIWDGSGWSSVQCLENLEQKCLVQFAHQNKGYKKKGADRVLIRMHDHLRDMGRHVIDELKHPGRPPSRLWRADDISDYLLRIHHEMVTEVRGICEFPAPISSPDCITSDTRGPCSSSAAVAERALKLLHAEGDSVITGFNYSLRHLIWLRWYSCDANALCQLCAPNLRVLELSGFRLDLNRLWQGKNQVLRELYVEYLLKLPKSIGFLKNLEKIVLHNGQMTTLPDELCQLLLLNHLDLSGCHILGSLPSGFGKLRNLRHLDLSKCSELEALPESFYQLTQLQYLSLYGSRQVRVCENVLRNIVTLEYLDLNSNKLQTLPTHITKQMHLRNLYVDCYLLAKLPVDMDALCNLRVLNVTCKQMTALPSSLKGLSLLKSLDLSGCESLQYLPESIGQLQALEYLNLSYTAIQVLPQGVAHLRNLVELDAYCCELGEFTLSNPRVEEKPEDSSAKAMIRLQSIDLSFSKIRKLCIAPDVCPNLETLMLSYCDSLIQVEALPRTLINLELNECVMLKKVQELKNLTRLRYFDIRRCFELEELDDLSDLRSLERFAPVGCWKLTKMEGLQQLQHLQHVEINACTAGIWKGIECLKELPFKVRNITLSMQTAGAERIQLYEILNSLGSSICMHDLQYEVKYTPEPSEVRSCSGLIIILLWDSERIDDDSGGHLVAIKDSLIIFHAQNFTETGFESLRSKSECQRIILCMFRKGSSFLRDLEQIELCGNNASKTKGWAVFLKDEKCKMKDIWRAI